MNSTWLATYKPTTRFRSSATSSFGYFKPPILGQGLISRKIHISNNQIISHIIQSLKLKLMENKNNCKCYKITVAQSLYCLGSLASFFRPLT